MSLRADQIRAALDHAVEVADLDATAPVGVGRPTAPVPDVGNRPRNAAMRRRSALVAAAVVLFAGLGLAMASVGPDRDPATGGASRAPTGPVVAIGIDDATLTLIDTSGHSDPPPGAPAGAELRAHIQIFESTDGRIVAVADRSVDGDGSLDRFPLETVSTVERVEVTSAKGASELTSGMRVSGWTAGDRHIRVATRGLAQREHDDLMRSLVVASSAGSLREEVPEGFSRVYAGPDDNPFYGLPPGSAAAYEDDQGRTVFVRRIGAVISATELLRYAWYLTPRPPITVDGTPALLVDGEGGSMSLYVARPDGFIVVTGPSEDVTRYAAALVPLDAAGWESLRSTATAPGSIYQDVTAATQPP